MVKTGVSASSIAVSKITQASAAPASCSRNSTIGCSSDLLFAVAAKADVDGELAFACQSVLAIEIAELAGRVIGVFEIAAGCAGAE